VLLRISRKKIPGNKEGNREKESAQRNKRRPLYRKKK
jgi:hypothetical protein